MSRKNRSCAAANVAVDSCSAAAVGSELDLRYASVEVAAAAEAAVNFLAVFV